MTNSVDELEYADCIFVIGSNTTEAHPIAALPIMRAVREHGAKLIVCDPRAIDLVRFADMHLRQRSGTDVELLKAMMNVIIEEGLCDEAYIAERTEGFDEFKAAIDGCTPEKAAELTGVDPDMIRDAARTYATAERASIVYAMGITQHTSGTDNVLTLAGLAMMTGNVGRESTGVNPLRGQNNVQGSCDMGSLPNVYPGYQKVVEPEMQQKFEKAWGVSLSGELGLTVMEMMSAAASGELKAMYVMGENPVLSDPNTNHVKKAIENLDFLCVQDVFLTETAELADVVLPAASFAEKDGTFTNTERRVQRVRKALDPPGQALEDWQIISEIATRLGYPMNYGGASQILDEIASVTPLYGGMSFERVNDKGLQWPCPDKDHPGTKFLHEGQFKRGKGKFHATTFREAAEVPDKDYPYILTTGRCLEHFHTGTLTRRTKGLEELAPPAPFEISAADAERDGIEHGDTVEISSRRGTIQARANVASRSRPGTIFMSFHFKEAAVNLLTNDALDPVAKIPEYKICAVRLKKI